MRGGCPGGPLLVYETSRPLCLADVLNSWILLFDGVDQLLVHVLLVLAVILPQNSDIQDLFCGASSNAKTSLLFGCDLLCLWFQSVQDDFQYHFARMTNEANGSVVLTELQIFFLGECDDD